MSKELEAKKQESKDSNVNESLSKEEKRRKAKIRKKCESEQLIVSEMIELFCRKKHGSSKGEPCASCRELIDYAKLRSSKCPFMETKTFCANCKVHCYKPEMREKIREVMRYSGPRILFSHPLMATWHLITSKREKRRIAKEEQKKASTAKTT